MASNNIPLVTSVSIVTSDDALHSAIRFTTKDGQTLVGLKNAKLSKLVALLLEQSEKVAISSVIGMNSGVVQHGTQTLSPIQSSAVGVGRGRHDSEVALQVEVGNLSLAFWVDASVMKGIGQDLGNVSHLAPARQIHISEGSHQVRFLERIVRLSDNWRSLGERLRSLISTLYGGGKSSFFVNASSPGDTSSNNKLTDLDIYRQANAFYRTIDHLHRTCDRNQITSIAIPICVLSAFACELQLKCLVYIETGRLPAKTHLLHDLFLKLSPASQSRLETLWDRKVKERKEILDRIDTSRGKPQPRDLRSNLIAGNDSFQLLRYIYEGGRNFEFFLSDLPQVLRILILELKPEWKAS